MDGWCQTSTPEVNVSEWRLVGKADLETFEAPEVFPFSDPGEFELGLWPVFWPDLQQKPDRDAVDI